MVSCYDCERFGISCLGIVPPMEYKDRVHEYCTMFKAVWWRHELYKPSGKSIL